MILDQNYKRVRLKIKMFFYFTITNQDGLESKVQRSSRSECRSECSAMNGSECSALRLCKNNSVASLTPRPDLARRRDGNEAIKTDNFKAEISVTLKLKNPAQSFINIFLVSLCRLGLVRAVMQA